MSVLDKQLNLHVYITINCIITLDATIQPLLLFALGALEYWNLTFQPCPSVWCYTLATNHSLNLSHSATYKVRLSVTRWQHSAVLIDRLVALPSIFLNASSVLGTDENERFQTTCDVINNDMKSVYTRRFIHQFANIIERIC